MFICGSGSAAASVPSCIQPAPSATCVSDALAPSELLAESLALTNPGMTQSEYRRCLEAGERKQVLRAKKERKLSDASQLDFDHGQILQMHFG